MQAGDRVLLYTDGILDSESPGGTMYEEDRLTAALAGRPPSIGVDDRRARRRLDAFAAGHEPGDDQTLVVVGIS